MRVRLLSFKAPALPLLYPSRLPLCVTFRTWAGRQIKKGRVFPDGLKSFKRRPPCVPRRFRIRTGGEYQALLTGLQ